MKVIDKEQTTEIETMEEARVPEFIRKAQVSTCSFLIKVKYISQNVLTLIQTFLMENVFSTQTKIQMKQHNF